jgi:hypothetical protein
LSANDFFDQPSQVLRKRCVLLRSQTPQEFIMKRQDDLIGKTITGIMAVPTNEDGPLKIWMLQFSDGTHVEFVSPGARRTLDRLAGKGAKASRGRLGRGTGTGGERSRKVVGPQSQSECSLHPQLALNVA